MRITSYLASSVRSPYPDEIYQKAFRVFVWQTVRGRKEYTVIFWHTMEHKKSLSEKDPEEVFRDIL